MSTAPGATYVLRLNLFLRFYFLNTPFPFPHKDGVYFIYSDLLFRLRLLLFIESSAELHINVQESAIIYCYRKYLEREKSWLLLEQPLPVCNHS